MLEGEVDHKKLYQLNIHLVNSCILISDEIYQNIKFYNSKILNHVNHLYNSYSNNISMKESYKDILNHIEIHSLNEYCQKFSAQANLDDLKLLTINYGADQIWFTQHLSALSAKSPEKAAIEIYKNLYDEIGQSIDKDEASGFHPNIFRRLYHLFNMPISNRFDIHSNVLETTFACINIFILSTKLDYLTGAGALFVLEKTIPTQLHYILERIKVLGISFYDREFFEIHTVLDNEHAYRWWKFCIEPYLQSQNDLKQLLLGINLGIYARNLLWHGLHNNSSFKSMSF